MTVDIEMARRKDSRGPAPAADDDTEYKPINWKKVFLTPKYIRTSSLELFHRRRGCGWVV
jgi:hypothetical protein